MLAALIIMRKEKHLFASYLALKALKTQQLCHYRHARKTSRHVLLYVTGSRNNCAYLGVFAKASVPVETIIPWLYQAKALKLTKATKLRGPIRMILLWYTCATGRLYCEPNHPFLRDIICCIRSIFSNIWFKYNSTLKKIFQ